MPRKERLPQNVSSFVDRHGKLRYRWRSKGQSRYFKAHPNSPAGRGELAAFKAGQDNPPERDAPGTVGWIAKRFFASPAFTSGKGADRIRHVQRVLSPFIERFGSKIVANCRFDHIETYLGEVATPRIGENGRKRGGPHAAITMRDELLPLFRYAIKLELIVNNPVELADVPRPPKTGGYHTWTEGEIARYRAAHPLGTMARFVCELALNTSGRRCNLATLPPAAMADGRIAVEHAKDGNEVSVPLLATTKAAYDALAVKSTVALVVNAYGKPFSVAGLGNKMRDWCDGAGLPQCSLHGLRKATSRRVAESGGTDAEGMSVTGQKKSETFTHYRAAANRAAMADAALGKIAEKFDK